MRRTSIWLKRSLAVLLAILGARKILMEEASLLTEAVLLSLILYLLADTFARPRLAFWVGMLLVAALAAHGSARISSRGWEYGYFDLILAALAAVFVVRDTRRREQTMARSP